MFFQPPVYKKKKYKHRFSLCFQFKKKTTINLFFGIYGLKALENGYITPNQLETIRRIFSKKLKNKHGKFWIRLIPNLPLSKKASETRMGKGKSPIRKWVAIVRSGIILFEVSGLIYKNIIPLLKIAQKKLSIRTKIIIKN